MKSKQQLLDKWIPRMRYTSFLTSDYFEMCKDLEQANIEFDIFFDELNKRC